MRYVALIFIGVIGLTIGLAFVYLSAPDLALTQISVEVVTILLLLLALNLLPKKPPPVSSWARRGRDGALGVAAGAGLGWIAYALMTRTPPDPVSAQQWALAKPEGGGTNVVNVILVDFRAFDTFGEIIVLGIAALIIYALLEPALRGASGRRLAAWKPETRRSPERHPMMLVVGTRILLPMTVAASFYLFARGHNMPGGGFISGLIFAIGILMQYMASGYDWAAQRRPLNLHGIVAWGVIIATATGLGAIVLGLPLFTTGFDYFTWPLVGTFELATAMIFDAGVFLVVIGAVLLALQELAHVLQRAEKFGPSLEPMDVDPSRTEGRAP